MAWQQVTAGEDVMSLTKLSSYEDAIAEGQNMRLDLNLKVAAPTDITAMLQDTLQSQGVPATVQALGNTVRVIARKGFPWLAVIAAAVLGLIVLAALIVSWQLFREVKEVVPQPIIIVGAIVGIVLLAVITYVIARRGGI